MDIIRARHADLAPRTGAVKSPARLLLPEKAVAAFEKAPPEARQLLTVPIRELGLRLDQSPVAEYVRRLYAELEGAGLRHFRPLCYLSDEWGCPSEEPVIGIPFYLGDPRVAHLEDAVNDIENEREIMMYLRHEAGHAFNYAYELYRTDEWHELFGSFRRPYRDDYPFVPFSRDYVRHIAGWYAQKHPDEDFAETFAVWLDPDSHWQQRYAHWPALGKLQYVDRIAAEVRDLPPPHAGGQTDITVDEMEQTVEEFYRGEHGDESAMIAGLALDTDLTDIFLDPSKQRDGVDYRPADDLLAEHRRDIIDKVYEWTGVRRTLVRALVSAVEQRLRELGLLAVRERSRSQMIELTVYITALSMTFLIGKRPLRHRKVK
jgi:GNAT superfamily N-acetyltransferase